ncbi:MAG: hypothetical protein HY760_01715 [Nitrospirae bacterium]|nr:hypothetical protein [Nitrospirota bacterium]
MMNRKITVTLGLLAFLGVAAGCGSNLFEGMEDKESTEATQYATLKSLDSGDFAAVLAACDQGTADPIDCSAAALGAAGLDPIDVANKLNDLINSTASGDISSIASLSIDSSYLDEIHEANVLLAEECEATGDDNACSQLVVTSIAEVVVAIAQVGDNASIDVTDGIDTIEAQQIADIVAGTSSFNDMVDTNGDGTPETPVVDLIEEDALYIELGQVIEEQVQTIGGADCAAGSTTCVVTSGELETYLDTEYGSSL